MNDYIKQGEDFLTSAGLTFSVRRIGLDCPKFCGDAGKHVADIGRFPRRTHIHGNHYLATFSRMNGPLVREFEGKGWRLPEFSVDFWNSYNDEEFNFCIANPKKPRIPNAYDVITCFQKSDPGTFKDFCLEYGYDDDSRKAEEVWRACCAEWDKVRRFFTPEEVEQLQEIQ